MDDKRKSKNTAVLLYEGRALPVVWTQCPLVCFVAPPTTQTLGCLCPHWHAARFSQSCAKTNCLYPCRDGPWKCCSVRPSSRLYAAEQGNHPFCHFWSQREVRHHSISAQLRLVRVRVYSANHNSVIWARTRAERVMVPLYASSFRLPS